MRVLVTGASGFVGRWMVRELGAAGHEAAGTGVGRVDITDAAAVTALARAIRPDGVIHLAAISFAPDAARDPEAATRVNAGGTSTLLRALAGLERPPSVVVAGSSEVYGNPDPGDLPLSERAPVRPISPYGRSKLAQEEVALEVATTGSLPIAVTRSFNHTGPGQRPEFVAPALARRIIEARGAGSAEIPVGNVDVRRDIGDVRDYARAYRLILEGLAEGSIPSGSVLNVATGTAVAIRTLIEMLADLVGITVQPRRDEALVRAGDPPVIVGDASDLARLTGWRPSLPLRQTLQDLVTSLEAPA